MQRQFCAEMARVERWSVQTLCQKIQGMLYERTAISHKPEELARQELGALQEEDRMTPDLVFRDPYLLDFLGLEDTYSERDLVAAIRSKPHYHVTEDMDKERPDQKRDKVSVSLEPDDSLRITTQ